MRRWRRMTIHLFPFTFFMVNLDRTLALLCAALMLTTLRGTSLRNALNYDQFPKLKALHTVLRSFLYQTRRGGQQLPPILSILLVQAYSQATKVASIVWLVITMLTLPTSITTTTFEMATAKQLSVNNMVFTLLPHIHFDSWVAGHGLGTIIRHSGIANFILDGFAAAPLVAFNQ